MINDVKRCIEEDRRVDVTQLASVFDHQPRPRQEVRPLGLQAPQSGAKGQQDCLLQGVEEGRHG